MPLRVFSHHIGPVEAIPTHFHSLGSPGKRYVEANGIILNTAADLEPRVLAAIADGRCARGAPVVYPIGPVLALTPPANAAEKELHECVRWLDLQPPASVLFLCFGGKGFMSTAQVHEIAHGLERSGQRFLWVLRRGHEPFATEAEEQYGRRRL